MAIRRPNVWNKIKNGWNKTKKFLIPLGTGILAVFAFIGGRGSNRRTVSKIEKINSELRGNIEQLRRNNEQLERNLRETGQNLNQRQDLSRKQQSATLKLHRNNERLRVNIDKANQLIREIEEANKDK